MSVGFDFVRPWLLLLLPLALLPLLRRRGDTLAFSHVAWLPVDRWGRVLGFVWRALAVVAILTTVLALAGPGRPETEIIRTGRGAEILVLMDRSRSMDERMLPSDWRTIDPLNLRLQAESRGERKSAVARELLSRFVTERADDRFALMLFSPNPIPVVSFTQHDEVVQAAIAAAGVGRGLSTTDVGWALITAIREFDHRAYSGSRIILLISDGGARLDDETQRQIAAGLLRNRITLNWLYLRSINGPDLNSTDHQRDWTSEMALHRFFQGLRSPYRAYQAESPEDLAKSIADVGKQQNLPLDFAERVPRRDFSRTFVAAAALCCLLLLTYRSMQLRSWS